MINNIKLKNFRNIENLELNTNYNLIILSGNNAIGKTSILEAIYYISTSKSHRTNEIEELINKNNDFFKIELKSFKNFKSIYSREGKTNFINNVEINKISDYIGNIKCVFFSPYDLNLIDGTKSDKRHFLDLEISILNKKYLYHLSNYKKRLKERNELLKIYKEKDKMILDILTKNLIEELKIILDYRINFLKELNIELEKIIFFNETIKLDYLYSFNKDEIEKSFNSKLEYDIKTKTTNIGIHRDDFLIYLNNMDATIYASQGQKRSIVIAIKLALKEYIKNKYNEVPILLLDDVFGELDDIRQQSLITYLIGNNQTFITTTTTLSIPDELLKEAHVINLSKEISYAKRKL